MNAEELDQLLGATTWEQFDATAYGIIDIYYKGHLTYPVSFRMSTGLYFGKPVQAIMALGQFVRMREFKCDPEDWEFKELDPSQPSILTSNRRYIFGNANFIGWMGNMAMSNSMLSGILTT